MDSSRSVFPPHIQPPIAHVPKAIREAVSPDAPIRIVSMVLITPFRSGRRFLDIALVGTEYIASVVSSSMSPCEHAPVNEIHGQRGQQRKQRHHERDPTDNSGVVVAVGAVA